MIEARDSRGNAASPINLLVTVRLADTDPPVLNLPADMSMTTDPGMATAQVDFLATALDGVDGPVAVQFVTSPTAGLSTGSAFPVGTTTVSASATAAAGNRTEVGFDVAVRDTRAPVLAGVPGPMTLGMDELATGYGLDLSTLGITATDLADGPVPVLFRMGGVLASGTVTLPEGVTVIGSEAVDGQDNAATPASVTITVVRRDQTAPVLNLPDDITIDADPGQATAIVTFVASALDARDGTRPLTIASSPTAGLFSGSAFPVGTTAMLVSAVDNSGNDAFGTFTDSVSTERWLATMRLSGTVDLRHSLTLRPNVDLEWTRDTSEAYVDSLGVPVAAQTVEHRSPSVGLDWRKVVGLAARGLTLDGGIAFDLAGTQAATGRVDLGVLYLPRPGETISLNLFAEGLGGNTRTIGIELSYGLEF